MPSLRYPLAAVTLIATSAMATTSRADETRSTVGVATLQPESSEALGHPALRPLRRPITYTQILERDRVSDDEQPLLDFAFAFSRAIAGREDDCRCSRLGLCPHAKVASMQHQDVVIAEMEAREAQITLDMDVEAPLSESPAKRGDLQSDTFTHGRISRLPRSVSRVSLNSEATLDRAPTYVETQIEGGFPEGRIAASSARISVPANGPSPISPRESVDVPSTPAINHLVSYPPKRDASNVQVAIEGVALRYWEEGATRRHYR